jgi:proline iminopeptidase
LEDIEQYTVARHKSYLEKIIKIINAEKVILTGQSWGSVLATFFTVENHTKVEKIIMTGPGPVFPINNSLAKLKPLDSLNVKDPIFSNQVGNKEIYTFRYKFIRWYSGVFGKKLVLIKKLTTF